VFIWIYQGYAGWRHVCASGRVLSVRCGAEEQHGPDGLNVIVVYLFIGALLTLLAAYAMRRLKSLLGAAVEGLCNHSI
jgi:hypothetical protein